MKTAALVAVAIIATPGLASAQARSAPPPMPIRYADLNLSDPKDAAAMLVRIRKAAVDACRSFPGQEGNGIADIERFEVCYRQAVQSTVGVLNAPLVTAAFQFHAGRAVLARR